MTNRIHNPWRRVALAWLAGSALLAWSGTAVAQSNQGGQAGSGQSSPAALGAAGIQPLGSQPSAAGRVGGNTATFSGGPAGAGGRGGANASTGFRRVGAAGPGNPSGNLSPGNSGVLNSALGGTNAGGGVNSALGGTNAGGGVSPSNLFGPTFGNPLAGGIPSVRGQVPFGQPLFNFNTAGFNGGAISGRNFGQRGFGQANNFAANQAASFQTGQGQPIASFLPSGGGVQMRVQGNSVFLNGVIPLAPGSASALQQRQIFDAMRGLLSGAASVPADTNGQLGGQVP